MDADVNKCGRRDLGRDRWEKSIINAFLFTFFSNTKRISLVFFSAYE